MKFSVPVISRSSKQEIAQNTIIVGKEARTLGNYYFPISVLCMWVEALSSLSSKITCIFLQTRLHYSVKSEAGSWGVGEMAAPASTLIVFNIDPHFQVSCLQTHKWTWLGGGHLASWDSSFCGPPFRLARFRTCSSSCRVFRVHASTPSKRIVGAGKACRRENGGQGNVLTMWNCAVDFANSFHQLFLLAISSVERGDLRENKLTKIIKITCFAFRFHIFFAPASLFPWSALSPHYARRLGKYDSEVVSFGSQFQRLITIY